MKVSPYALLQPDGEGGAWLINGLFGQQVHVERKAWEAFTGERTDPTAHADLTGRLVASRILETSDEDQRGLYRLLEQSLELSEVWRFGYMLDYLTAQTLESTSDYVSSVLGSADVSDGTVMINAWCYTEAGRRLLRGLPSAVRQSSVGDADLRVALHTTGSQVFEDDDLLALEALSVSRSNGAVVFMLTAAEVERAGGPADYSRQLFAQQSRIYSVGFHPHFVFQCTRETVDFMMGPVFDGLCFSGVYPRNMFLTLVEEHANPLAHACELYGADWSLYGDVADRLARSARHQLLEPLGRGFASKLRALFRNGSEPPTVRYCPFARQSFIFGVDGKVTTCPVAHGYPSLPEPKALPLVVGDVATGEVDTTALENWEGRGPTNVPGCASCRVAPLCGSGCPLEAVESSGELNSPACPPVPDILATEVAIAMSAGTAT